MVGICLLLAMELPGDVLLPPFNRWGNRDLERFEQLNSKSHSKMQSLVFPNFLTVLCCFLDSINFLGALAVTKKDF